MSRTERVHQIVHMLEHSRRPVPIQRFLDELEVSRATFKRDLEYLRDRLGAPIRWARAAPGTPNGYLLEHEDARPAQPGFGLHGLWFNQSEIYALLMMHQLATSMEPGLIAAQSASLLARITHLLGTAEDDPQAVLSYIRILHSATRRRGGTDFETIARCTVRRRRLLIDYFTRSRNQAGEREVSPQRLLHYRENWYLLAWCHRSRDLRLFAVDAIRSASELKRKARAVSARRLDAATDSGFGIFSGPTRQVARLRFSPTAARWIADEVWHPRQRLRRAGDHLVMELPYTQSRELIMEILRHGSDVEVLSPPALRDEVRARLRQALAQYDATP